MNNSEEQEFYLEALMKTTQMQSQYIDDLTTTVGQLAEQVEQRPTKKLLFRVIAGVAGLLLAIIVVLDVAAYNSGNDILTTLEDCVNPEGECAQRSAANGDRIRGQIACNQEKVLYIIYPEQYIPLPFCHEVINTELDRIGGEIGKTTPRLSDNNGVEQVPPVETNYSKE